HRDLHPFPTRRSSDLLAAAAEEGDSMIWLHVLDVDSGHVQRCDVEVGTPACIEWDADGERIRVVQAHNGLQRLVAVQPGREPELDRKSTRLNSSHVKI